MSTAAALTLIALLLEIDGGFAVADRGAADGLRPGDRGLAFYTLYVGSDRRPVRIDAGELEVVAVEKMTARLALPARGVVHPGYSVEFHLPAERRSPPAGIDGTTPPPGADEPVRGDFMVPIPGGDHEVGADLGVARFYNQTPRFRATLSSFRIDRTPVAGLDFGDSGRNTGDTPAGDGPWAADLSFAEAEAHCRRLGKRLPTELEWEVAVRRSAIVIGNAFYEWTRSWYQAYPGNRFPEEEYGKRYRVLRGGAGDDDPRLRQFMAPGDGRADVGFRCARSDPD